MKFNHKGSGRGKNEREVTARQFQWAEKPQYIALPVSLPDPPQFHF